MKVHFLGVCGTFMGGLAMIARQLGYEVSGSDQHIYPPMSDVLKQSGIELHLDYLPEHLEPAPDLVVIGNAMKRGNPAVEYVLNQNIPFISGPQWLYEHVLKDKHVLAVSGTHGKTTTTSMLTWILTACGLKPGYLIGGVAENFEHTACLGDSLYFVIEADEYDTVFYDKRSKFLHYHPRTLIMNNLEFDHADIFDDLAAIQKQFQILLRVVPAAGAVIYPADDQHLQDVLKRGCWSRQILMGEQGDWRAVDVAADGSRFEVWHRDQKVGTVSWSLLGHHNVSNAIAAIAAAHDVGIAAPEALHALQSFKGVKRRLQVIGRANDVTIYDDFAHHPTAIQSTLKALRAHANHHRVVAVIEFASNTMRDGVHQASVADACQDADLIYLLRPENCQWPIEQVMQPLAPRVKLFERVEQIVADVKQTVEPHDHVVIMSNKGFGGIHSLLVEAVASKDKDLSTPL